MKKTFQGILLAAMFLLPIAGAQAAGQVTSSFTTAGTPDAPVQFTMLGLEQGFSSDFDHLSIVGKSGIISGQTGSYDIASLTFTAGYNAWNIHDSTGSLNFDIAINGNTAVLTLPYTIHIDTTDTLNLNIGGGNLVTSGNAYNVATQSLTFANVGNNGPVTKDLYASISVSPVPEPETYGMMLMGLGLMGFVARRRKSNEV